MQQVLMHRADGAAPRFELRDNPGNRSPLSFEDQTSGTRIPRLGTEDLLAIAKYAERSGLHVDGFTLEDHAFSALPDEAQDELSDVLADVLRRDGVAEASRLIDEDFGYYVTGVKLTTADLRSFTLLREGVTRTTPAVHLEHFLDEAWGAVRFS